MIAYHEAGHALVGKSIANADPIHKITIIPRGRALGLTFSLPTDDRYINKKDYIVTQLAIMLGGRQAEWLVFNERSTGCSNDIERATELARRMVCDWGMSEKMGPITFGKKDEEIFLGRSISQHRDYSEFTAQSIDGEVRRIVEEQITRVDKILLENRDKLELLARSVLEYEVLDGEEIDIVLRGEKIDLQKRNGGNNGKKEAAPAVPPAEEPVKPVTENGEDDKKGLNVDTQA